MEKGEDDEAMDGVWDCEGRHGRCGHDGRPAAVCAVRISWLLRSCEEQPARNRGGMVTVMCGGEAVVDHLRFYCEVGKCKLFDLSFVANLFFF